ncbi:MAG: hypothetical protein EOP53_17290 [Sphingobacteriales bacterium]|nr:MAG: hypothetical protein EOP53_17290 [Sphingobacteriales bacterium]
MYNLLYDGSFAGFLTALNRKMNQPMLEISIKQANGLEDNIYAHDILISTQPGTAKQIVVALKQYFSAEEIQFMKRIIKQAKPGCEDLLSDYISNKIMNEISGETKISAAA